MRTVTLARKPFKGTVGECVAAHGCGGIDVDGCRIQTLSTDNIHAKNPHTVGGFGQSNAMIYGKSNGSDPYNPSKGRWPANTILQHQPSCVLKGTKTVYGTGIAVNRNRPENTKNSWMGVRKSLTGADTGYAGESGSEEVDDWDCDPTCPVRRMNTDAGILGEASRFFKHVQG